MRKLSLCGMFFVLVSAVSFAQDLDTVSVFDQFNSGSRSDQANGLGYSSPTYPGITGTINYITSFEGGNADETKVYDVTTTAVVNDIGAGIPPVLANSGDTSSTTQNMAVYIGDGGGGQNLQFGELNDADYTLVTAMWAEPRPAPGDDTLPATGWERMYATIRIPVDTSASGNNVDAEGGYAINFETDHAKFQAVEWNPLNAGALGATAVANRDAAVRTVYGESAAISVGGWHVLKISALGSDIKFYVDGVSIAEITDTTFAAGSAGLCYRERFNTGNNERQGKFDYVGAGPTPTIPSTGVARWDLFE